MHTHLLLLLLCIHVTVSIIVSISVPVTGELVLSHCRRGGFKPLLLASFASSAGYVLLKRRKLSGLLRQPGVSGAPREPRGACTYLLSRRSHQSDGTIGFPERQNEITRESSQREVSARIKRPP